MWSGLARKRQSSPRSDPHADTSPVAELYSLDQLAAHAAALSRRWRVSRTGGTDRVLDRLGDQAEVLAAAYAAVAEGASLGRRISPAGEWLLDNYYLIEDQIRTARRHLPRRYARQLPLLETGRYAGLPRVAALAMELIIHVDGRVERSSLEHFIRAFQTSEALTLGELWAVPIMLRLSLIQVLSRVAARLRAARAEEEAALRWSERFICRCEAPTELVIELADFVRAEPLLSHTFVAELARLLHGQHPSISMVVSWIEQRLYEQGSSIEQHITAARQAQATDQVSMVQSIASLRELSAIDWPELVESVSEVHAALGHDPTSTYLAMEFAGRDRYRHVVEAVARWSGRPEPEVARQAVSLAASAVEPRRRHVGYWLIDEGRADLEAALGARRPPVERAVAAVLRRPLGAYLGAIALLTALPALALLSLPGGLALALAPFLLLAASRAAVAVVERLVTVALPPRTLPRLELSAGIPDEHRTLVAVPCLLSDLETVGALLDRLEINAVANRDPNLGFALVADFRDAAHPTEDDDDLLLSAAKAGIEGLERRHGPGRFVLLHRARAFSPTERCWKGRERKRGKIEDLNAALRGDLSAFPNIAGARSCLDEVRYVLSLDADTQLPPDVARGLIATLAHPLHQAVVDPERRVVVEGHGVIQPQVAVSLPNALRSRFANICSGEVGVDPYTRAVSNVYQDLFGEGSFIGKGLYDVDVFRATLCGRLPDARILSHDLLEGCYARSALADDLELVEHTPTAYVAELARRHRWTRGDWQIARWAFPTVPTRGGGWERNPLSPLSRWKILDNLRRSLVSPAMLFGLALTAAAPSPVPLAALFIGFWMVPPALSVFAGLLGRPEDTPWSLHLRSVAERGGDALELALLQLALLPVEAMFELDAILRTLWRLGVSHRRLLEWTPAQVAEQRARTDLAGAFRTLAAGPIAAIFAFAAAFLVPSALPVALPLGLLWTTGPVLAWAISRPMRAAAQRLADEDLGFLRLVARRTWRWFEDFVRAEEHFLAPDNYQEEPLGVVAHRTSPTNVAMGLLSALAARDLGYVGLGSLIERTGLTLETLEGMERHRGHLLNWYDTRTLEPLLPRYVSMVDNGNLAASLVVLEQGLLELRDAPVAPASLAEGLYDALVLLRDASPAGCSWGPELARLIARSPGMPGDVPALAALLEAAARIGEEASVSEDPLASGWGGALARQARGQLDDLASLGPATPLTATWRELARREDEAGAAASRVVSALTALAARCRALSEMDFRLLYDPQRELFSIGYNVTEHRLDAARYDLLASEARLASYLAIARGQVGIDHWFRLGRLLTSAAGERTLLSWSGSMFEYLMPLLVMPSFGPTLLDRSCRGAVNAQIRYGRARGVPWGISESGYNLTDQHLIFQYRAFGVPGLGLKRGLGQDLVVAPYASALALLVAPRTATANLRRLDAEGRQGTYGFYEAVDYTPARVPPRQAAAVVRSYMAHHQGMTLLSITAVLAGRPMQRRFHADPELAALELLLHERVPRGAAVVPHPAEAAETRPTPEEESGRLYVVRDPDLAPSQVHLLSNGRYHVMVNAAGAGWSRRGDLAVTRWRGDPVSDAHGVFCYLRDPRSGETWSTSHAPTARPSTRYEAIFTVNRAEFRRGDLGVEVHVEIAVSPEDDVELRRVTLSNRWSRPREIELTTYAEIVLAPAGEEVSHPAFSKLFVETERLGEQPVLLARRRARRPGEHTPWLVHLLAVHGGENGPSSVETSREAFLGRHGSVHRPAALRGPPRALGGHVGAVLDPVVAIRQGLRLPVGGDVTVDVVTGIAETREEAVALANRYKERYVADRVFELAWTYGQVLLRQLNATETDAQRYRVLAAALVYPSAARRAPASLLLRNRRDQASLWAYGISGDLPLVLLRIHHADRMDLVIQALRAHAWWRRKGFAVDLVIAVDEEGPSYRQPLYDHVVGLVAAGPEAGSIDRPGGVFVRRAEHMSAEDRTLLATVALLVLDDEQGSFAQQVERRRHREPLPPPLRPTSYSPDEPMSVPRPYNLRLDNGYGGFSADGREYVIVQEPGRPTPLPWSNVLANPHFGSVVTEAGGAYTWLENCHELRLTPWNNDPVTDASGEALYVRDDETGRCWSPTPLPAPGRGRYLARHGFGRSSFETAEAGIVSELLVAVAEDAPVKVHLLRLANQGDRLRRLSVFAYAQWVLGAQPARTRMHIATSVDHQTRALLASSWYGTELPGRLAFLDLSEASRYVTGDRAEFLGVHGSLAAPAALDRARLGGRIGAGYDPCGAIQAQVELHPGESREIVVLLGVGRDPDDVRTLIGRFGAPERARRAIGAASARWDRIFSAVQVQTPVLAVDLLVNGWLPYQTISSRLWARSGYYQSGGAYGFRDQLQDVLSLLHHAPELAREHLVRAAGRQFEEGDVQHWWHPPLGRGVRTRFSDDYLWLPFAVCRYLEVTGDEGVLDETAGYLEGRPVPEGEEAYYDLPGQSPRRGTLYEHCVRAVRHGLRFGPHGLPLMGCGDWNDAMNRVGEHGRGESVWLAFFLVHVLRAFAPVARARGDAFAETCEREGAALIDRIEASAWDGGWYLRAWFDDGTPLGSATSPECRIDALPQSWAVLSGAAPPARARQAVLAAADRLVDEQAGLAKLFAPPFDTSSLEPGYIKGYPPGIRENGGQYTHAAVWLAMALFEIGEVERGWAITRLLLPPLHGLTPDAVARFRVEPYVAAADVYASPQHLGRGGWTWYTGSAGWMWRLLAETMLGLRRRGAVLYVEPKLPAAWDGARIDYRYKQSLWRISVQARGGPRRMTVDGAEVEHIQLVDDGAEHVVVVEV